MTEAQLLEAAIARDERAYAELVEPHRRPRSVIASISLTSTYGSHVARLVPHSTIPPSTLPPSVSAL